MLLSTDGIVCNNWLTAKVVTPLDSCSAPPSWACSCKLGTMSALLRMMSALSKKGCTSTRQVGAYLGHAIDRNAVLNLTRVRACDWFCRRLRGETVAPTHLQGSWRSSYNLQVLGPFYPIALPFTFPPCPTAGFGTLRAHFSLSGSLAMAPIHHRFPRRTHPSRALSKPKGLVALACAVLLLLSLEMSGSC